MAEQVTEVAVTLAKAHTHAGKSYQAGATILVNPVVAEWLVKNQIATIERKPKARRARDE